MPLALRRFIYFLLPLLLLVAALVEMMFALPVFKSSGFHFVGDLVANILFCSIIHIPMTYVFLSHTDQGQSWLKNQRMVDRGLLLRFLFCALFFLFIFNIQSLFSAPPQKVMFIVLLVKNILPAHHYVAQWYGLFRNQFGENYSAKNLQRIKILLQSFAITKCFLNISLIFYLISSGHWANVARDACFVVVGILVGLLVSLVSQSKTSGIKELLFIVPRLLIGSTVSVSVISGFSTSALHGSEAMTIYGPMVAVKPMDSRRKLLYVFYIGLTILLTYSVSLTKGWASHPWFFKFLTSLATTQTFTHYFAETYLFRMKDPVSRRYILPLTRFSPPESQEEFILPLPAQA